MLVLKTLKANYLPSVFRPLVLLEVTNPKYAVGVEENKTKLPSDSLLQL